MGPTLHASVFYFRLMGLFFGPARPQNMSWTHKIQFCFTWVHLFMNVAVLISFVLFDFDLMEFTNGFGDFNRHRLEDDLGSITMKCFHVATYVFGLSNTFIYVSILRKGSILLNILNRPPYRQVDRSKLIATISLCVLMAVNLYQGWENRLSLIDMLGSMLILVIFSVILSVHYNMALFFHIYILTATNMVLSNLNIDIERTQDIRSLLVHLEKAEVVAQSVHEYYALVSQQNLMRQCYYILINLLAFFYFVFRHRDSPFFRSLPLVITTLLVRQLAICIAAEWLRARFSRFVGRCNRKCMALLHRDKKHQNIARWGEHYRAHVFLASHRLPALASPRVFRTIRIGLPHFTDSLGFVVQIMVIIYNTRT